MTICPKCGYERKFDDSVPEEECPECGIIYEKYKERTESPPALPAGKRSPVLLISVLFVAALIFGIFFLHSTMGIIDMGPVRPEPEPENYVPIARSIGPVLWDSYLTEVSSDSLLENEYSLIYFSASWCAPCVKFTPELINFYNKHKESRSFEVILVSEDRSEREAKQYVEKYRMPWLSIPFSDGETRRKLRWLYGSPGIPNLVLADASGKIVAGSYAGGNYVGPRNALVTLEKIWGL